jgi:hypothetical protein
MAEEASKSKKEKIKRQDMGTKGRKNIKKPKQNRSKRTRWV